MRRFSVATFAVLISFISAAEAGVLVDPSALDAKTLALHGEYIAKARTQHAAAFDVLQKLRADLPRLDSQKRGRFLSLSKMLRPLAQKAPWVLVNELAGNGAPQGDLSASAWQGWRVSLVEALGMTRNAALAPMLRATVAKFRGDAHVMRASIVALARLGDNADVDLLVKAATSEKNTPAIQLNALGEHRRVKMAQTIVKLLDGNKWSNAEKRALLHALGKIGNAWAWKTSAIKRTGEGAEVRGIAAKKLLEVFLNDRESSVRKRAGKSFILVSAPNSPALFKAARLSSPKDGPAIDALDKLAASYGKSALRQ
jgi:hypothetical protein